MIDPSFLPKFKPLRLGALPVDHLKIFGLDLQPGTVSFTIPAQRHAFIRHPDTYMACAPYLSQTVTAPTHVGQSPRHVGEGFELIRQTEQAGPILLIAVLIKPTNYGVYLVKSTYPIDNNKLENRLRKGHIIRVK